VQNKERKKDGKRKRKRKRKRKEERKKKTICANEVIFEQNLKL
jgi:hypothetical protein